MLQGGLEGIKERNDEDLTNQNSVDISESESHNYTTENSLVDEENQDSDTSSVRDASVILYHPPTDAECSELTKKLKNQE